MSSLPNDYRYTQHYYTNTPIGTPAQLLHYQVGGCKQILLANTLTYRHAACSSSGERGVASASL